MGNELKEVLGADLPHLRTAYGVDVSERHVAVVNVHRTRNSLRSEVLLQVSTTNPANAVRPVLQQIQGVLEEGKGLLVASLPISSSSTRWLSAPFPSRRKAQRVLPALLDIELPLPLESCVYGFTELQPADGTTKALAIAAPRSGIEKRIAQLQSWQIDPQILDHEGLALWRQHCRLLSDLPTGLHVLVYLGTDRTVWCAGEGHRFLGAQETQTGWGKIAADPSATIPSWRDRGLRFLRLWLDATSTSPLPVHWVGPGAADPAVLTALQADWSDVQAHHQVHDQPASFLAQALATACVADDHETLNFRTGASTHSLVEKLQLRAMRRLTLAAVMVALVLGALNLILSTTWQRRLTSADQQITDLAREITGYSRIPRRQEVTIARRTMEEKTTELAPIRAHFEPPLAVDLLHILAAAPRSQWTIHFLQLTPGTVQIRGTAPGQNELRSFQASLSRTGWETTTRILTGIDPSRLEVHISGEKAP